MIDLRDLREHPDRYREGARHKGFAVDIDRLLELDSRRRGLLTEQESLRAEQKRIEKEIGPQIGRLSGAMKKAGDEADRSRLARELEELKARPAALKGQIGDLESQLAAIDPTLRELLLTVPLPADDDVPVGQSAEDNIEIRRWNPPGFDTSKSFEDNKGFKPRTHIELVRALSLADFERAVKMAGTRSYVLTGHGMRLHNAVLRYAFDLMVEKHGFTPVSVPVLVREEAMIGTAFFPAGREQAYHVSERERGGGHDLFLTGTGEVGLMGLHMDEILDEATLPRRYITVSTCFRREAGAAGKDTAGLYRIHQFDKVEQVVICRNDVEESRRWHKAMIEIVEDLLQSLELPYRLLQCCTGDLGPKNADQIDIESWMPGRGAFVDVDPVTGKRESGLVAKHPDARNLVPIGAYGETHSASRLYDYQCRRLNMRYRPGGEAGQGETTFCHSLNNTVIASPRILIPLLEMHQNADGTVTVPRVLRGYMGGVERIG
jgi:seryl-tRNA synthetase